MPQSVELFAQAIASFQARRLGDAERQFKALLQRDPKHVAALNILGVILTALSRYGEAKEYLRQALDVDSRSDATHYNYGLVLKALHEYEPALESFNKALAINPSVADTWNNRGTVFNNLKRYEEAIADFDKAISLQPDYAPAYYNKGKAFSELGRHEEALALYDKALALNPGIPEPWNGRANVLVALGRNEEALAAYDKTLALNPNFADAWCGRANTLFSAQRYNEALAAYDKALALNPNFADAWCGRANSLVSVQRYDEALAAYDKALALNAGLLGAWMGRTMTLAKLKRTSDAIAAARSALDCGADPEQINYCLAAAGAGTAPSASPQGYVTGLFDFYAGTFDRHLVDLLEYRIPLLMAEAVKRAAPSRQLDILDLGCGTGLVGEALASVKRSLIGVDLSENMLNVARKRGVYDQLIRADIVEAVQSYERAFDLVTAADVFVYIGELSSLFRGARRALRDDGLFCFSVETTSDGDYVLKNTLRYGQSVDYLKRLAQDNRFVVETMEPHTIRKEINESIDGYLVVMRCGA